MPKKSSKRQIFKKILNLLKKKRITLATILILFAVFFGYYHWSKRIIITEAIVFENTEKIKFVEELEKMVKDYPIEKMVPYIAELDPKVGAFMIAIAKKESNWGKRVPVLDGQDCYNYWGYRGIRERMGTGGHTCFATPEEAVEIVGKRVATLVEKQNLDTPQKMIVWKCGSTCAGHSDYGVKKWISDVNLYFQKIIRF